MNKADRTERNMRVVLMRMRQIPTREVAEAFGITDRQVRRIMANWRSSSLKRDTERAVETVNNALRHIRDDMEALGVAAANAASPAASVAIQSARIEQLYRNFSVLRDAGVSFEGLFDNQAKNLELVVDVNTAYRTTLEQRGVDPVAIVAAIEAGIEAFAKWGYKEPDIWML